MHFSSVASNLVPVETRFSDVYLLDRQTGELELISVSSTGEPADDTALRSASSADGRIVAFGSGAQNFIDPPETHKNFGTYVRDREAATTVPASVSTEGVYGDTGAGDLDMSADGRFAVFDSLSSNLVSDDTNGQRDVFVHDRETAVTERVSVTSVGGESQGGSGSPAISADGRYVAFESNASMDADGSNDPGPTHVFRHDRLIGETVLVSAREDGVPGNGDSRNASLSADGRYVAFESTASNLVPTYVGAFRQGSIVNVTGWVTFVNTGTSVREVFVRDMEAGTTERVSVDSAGFGGDAESRQASISADGRFVAFLSESTNLGGPVAEGVRNAYVHDRLTGATELISLGLDDAPADDHAGPGTRSSRPAISADGAVVAFQSMATNLVPEPRGASRQIYVRDRGRPLDALGLNALIDEDDVVVRGALVAAGGIVTSAQATGPPQDELARVAGATLRGAEVVHRPDRDDLLLRLRPHELPSVGGPDAPSGSRFPRLGGLPVVHYVTSLRVDDGTEYRVRGASLGDDSITGSFTLERCAPTCEAVSSLTGGIGTTGIEVRVAVPLQSVAAEPGSTLGELRAWTETAHGERLDEIAIPDATLSAPAILAALAPAGTPPSEVSTEHPAELDDDRRFVARLTRAELRDEPLEVHVSVCFRGECLRLTAPVAP